MLRLWSVQLHLSRVLWFQMNRSLTTIDAPYMCLDANRTILLSHQLPQSLLGLVSMLHESPRPVQQHYPLVKSALGALLNISLEHGQSSSVVIDLRYITLLTRCLANLTEGVQTLIAWSDNSVEAVLSLANQLYTPLEFTRGETSTGPGAEERSTVALWAWKTIHEVSQLGQSRRNPDVLSPRASANLFFIFPPFVKTPHRASTLNLFFRPSSDPSKRSSPARPLCPPRLSWRKTSTSSLSAPRPSPPKRSLRSRSSSPCSTLRSSSPPSSGSSSSSPFRPNQHLRRHPSGTRARSRRMTRRTMRRRRTMARRSGWSRGRW